MAEPPRRLSPPRATAAAAAEPADAAAEACPVADAAAHLAALQRANRAIKVNIGGAERFAAVEDAARLRDALGVRCPWACRWPSSSRSRIRWATSSPATPAPTVPSPPPKPPPGWDSASPSSAPR